MNIRIPRTGQAARIAKAYLKTLGLEVSHSQALELVARLHGYTDAQAMQTDKRFADAPALHPDSSTEYTLTGPKQSGVWIEVENISVHIKKDDEGVAVDLFAKGTENGERLTGTWVLYQDAQPICKKCGSPLDNKGYCTDATCPHSDWPQYVNTDMLSELSTEEVAQKFGVNKRPQGDPDESVQKKFYECGGCGHCHPLGWTGDCRDDSKRFTNQQLDDRYGAHGWRQVSEDGGEADDGAPARNSEPAPGHNLVVVYGDHLENFSMASEAARFVKKNLPMMPDRAFWEDKNCKELAEVDFLVSKTGDVTPVWQQQLRAPS